MLNKSHFLSTSAAALALSLVPHAASAQTAAGASDTETSEADSRDIGEIIVTAQKLSLIHI
jgi:hypothetical protein